MKWFVRVIVSIVVIMVTINIFRYFTGGLNNYKQECLYECTDSFGNIVYCRKVILNYGQTYGITDDGTVIKINQCKKIERID